jgi:hypothetical protein
LATRGRRLAQTGRFVNLPISAYRTGAQPVSKGWEHQQFVVECAGIGRDEGDRPAGDDVGRSDYRDHHRAAWAHHRAAAVGEIHVHDSALRVSRAAIGHGEILIDAELTLNGSYRYESAQGQEPNCANDREYDGAALGHEPSSSNLRRRVYSSSVNSPRAKRSLKMSIAEVVEDVDLASPLLGL